MKQKIIRQNILSEIQCKEGESLLSALGKAKVPLFSSCGGMGTCGTCRVIIREGVQLLDSPNEIEQEMIDERGFLPNERLACQIHPHEETIVEIPLSRGEDHDED